MAISGNTATEGWRDDHAGIVGYRLDWRRLIMKIKRLLSQILANRKNRLLYIVDASWEIFILLFPVWFILSNGKARLAETLGGNRDLASILICLTQLSMIYAEKVITYMIEKRADVK